VRPRALCKNRCGFLTRPSRLESTATLLETRNGVLLSPMRSALKRVLSRFNWSRVVILEPSYLQVLDSNGDW
jgi:hypothetical protein